MLEVPSFPSSRSETHRSKLRFAACGGGRGNYVQVGKQGFQRCVPKPELGNEVN
jgi:hypothetical protein